MRSEGYGSWVCLSVCRLSHISPLEHLFVLKSMSRIQRAMKVKKIVGISLKLLIAEIHHFLHCMAIRAVCYFTP